MAQYQVWVFLCCNTYTEKVELSRLSKNPEFEGSFEHQHYWLEFVPGICESELGWQASSALAPGV